MGPTFLRKIPSTGDSDYERGGGKLDRRQSDIFPNPTTQFINIELRNNESNMTAVVLDMSGKIVMSKNIESYQMETGFDLSDVAAGGYLLQITEKDGNFRSTHQIQKTK